MLKKEDDIIEYTGDRTHIIVHKNKSSEDLPFSGYNDLPVANDFGEYKVNYISEFRLKSGDIVISLSGTIKDPEIFNLFVIVAIDDDGVYVDESLMNNKNTIKYHRDAPFAANFIGKQVRIYRGITKVRKTDSVNVNLNEINIKTE